MASMVSKSAPLTRLLVQDNRKKQTPPIARRMSRTQYEQKLVTEISGFQIKLVPGEPTNRNPKYQVRQTRPTRSTASQTDDQLPDQRGYEQRIVEIGCRLIQDGQWPGDNDHQRCRHINQCDEKSEQRGSISPHVPIKRPNDCPSGWKSTAKQDQQSKYPLAMKLDPPDSKTNQRMLESEG